MRVARRRIGAARRELRIHATGRSANSCGTVRSVSNSGAKGGAPPRAAECGGALLVRSVWLGIEELALVSVANDRCDHTQYAPAMGWLLARTSPFSAAVSWNHQRS